MLATTVTAPQSIAAENRISAAVDQLTRGGSPASFLVVGAAGMGKTSMLGAAFRQCLSAKRGMAIGVSGGVIASEGHFFRSLSIAAGIGIAEHRRWEDCAGVLFDSLRTRAREGRGILIVVDEFDLLSFKREQLIETIAVELRRSPRVMLLASSSRSAMDRLVGSNRPLEDVLKVAVLDARTEAQARALVRLRAPDLPPAMVEFIIEQSGGHPAALVFMARLAQLVGGGSRASNPLEALRRWSGELAGSVYAEQWAALGPQQRAILWHASLVKPAPDTVARLAKGLFLERSHVSAQLSRLREEGLVVRGAGRGRYLVAPLLARWMTTRAVRWTVSGAVDVQDAPAHGQRATRDG